MNPNPVRLKLHRDQRELREQDLEREKLRVTAFTGDLRGQQWRWKDSGDRELYGCSGCKVELWEC